MLADFDARKSGELTELVRRECTLEKATDQLVTIYEKVLTDWSSQPPPNADQERLALLNYLRSLSTAVREVEWLPKQHEKESSRLKATIKDLKQLVSQSAKAERKLQALKESLLGRLALRMFR